MSSGKTKELQWQMRVLSLRLREEMGWALTEPVHLSALLRRKDILTLLRPLEDNFSGMALRVRDRKGNLHRFMLINTAQSYSKQRFTACHANINLPIWSRMLINTISHNHKKSWVRRGAAPHAQDKATMFNCCPGIACTQHRGL